MRETGKGGEITREVKRERMNEGKREADQPRETKEGGRKIEEH